MKESSMKRKHTQIRFTPFSVLLKYSSRRSRWISQRQVSSMIRLCHSSIFLWNGPWLHTGLRRAAPRKKLDRPTTQKRVLASSQRCSACGSRLLGCQVQREVVFFLYIALRCEHIFCSTDVSLWNPNRSLSVDLRDERTNLLRLDCHRALYHVIRYCPRPCKVRDTQVRETGVEVISAGRYSCKTVNCSVCDNVNINETAGAL